MRRKIIIISFLMIYLISSLFSKSNDEQKQEIYTEEVTYVVDGQEMVGFLAYDESITVKRPGILVVHEWRGINSYAKKRAVDLAKEGYVAFALDMYGDGKEIPIEEARATSGKIGSDFPLIEKRFNVGLNILKDSEYVITSQIAAIGYCFGGGIVLNMARLGTDINGVVGFHSSLNTGLTAKKGDITTRILAFQADKDPVAPIEKQQSFIMEMKDADADFSFITYGNVSAHNFTNPEGRTYYETEAELAWASMLSFFDSIF